MAQQGLYYTLVNLQVSTKTITHCQHTGQYKNFYTLSTYCSVQLMAQRGLYYTMVNLKVGAKSDG